MYCEWRKPQSLWQTFNGIDHHIRHWHGTGDPVLLLHGWMDASASFQFVVDRLPENWDIYALDWRGMGLSAHQQTIGHYDRAIMLADLADCVDWLSPNQAIHIVGHSLGGMLLAQYAAMLPEKVRSATIAEGFGIEDANLAESKKKSLRYLRDIKQPTPFAPIADYADFAHKLMRRHPALSEEKALYLSHALLKENEANGTLTHRADIKHKITQPLPYRLDYATQFWQQITSPVLWLQGELLPHNGYLNSISGSMNARYLAFGKPLRHTLAGSGHMLQWEAPEAFAQAVDNFWQSLA